jgi:hypothetical protein
MASFIVFALVGYLAYPKQWRINPSLLYHLSVLHNGFLVAFSGWTFISLAHILYQEGIVFQTNYYFQNPHFDQLIYWFYLSKYYEFCDTFLLYLNGKTPIFLQKYHHIGAVICWHVTYYNKTDGIWLATILNSFVHTIMYTYYLLCLLRIQRERVRFLKKYITTLQLCQLMPQPICLWLYRQETPSNYNILIGFTLYSGGLVCLFWLFFYRNYIQK